MFNKYKDEIYKEEIYSPPIDKIVFSNNFKDQINKDKELQQPDRKKEINIRIDELYRYILTNKKENPRSLSFKKLGGDNNKYEFYAWSDRDTKRVFCEFMEDKIIIERIDKHL